MKKFQVVKTVSYDLTAEVEVADDVTAESLILDIERDGDAWIDWEQSNGNDEVLTAFEIEGEEIKSRCVDCKEENSLHALNDDLRCDDCVEEWRAQENDK